MNKHVSLYKLIEKSNTNLNMKEDKKEKKLNLIPPQSAPS